ncbi:MAG TPA: 2-oxoglutarate dehydrogenase E1 component, partial [Candidatus Binatia bacterium]
NDWKTYFARFNGKAISTRVEKPTRGEPARQSWPREVRDEAPSPIQERLFRLIQAYRRTGHRLARIDPLNRLRRTQLELDPAFYGLTDSNLALLYPGELVHFAGPLTLRDILTRLQNTYCRSIAVEFMHISDEPVREWLAARMESTENRSEFSKEEQLRIFSRLAHGSIFEEFIRKKFLGAKSFSIEGGESLIPLLDVAIEKAAEQGQQEIVMAMAHRGRLNVLANIIGKPAREIFREFEDPLGRSRDSTGDVKYHLGHSHDYVTAAKRKIHLSLCFNPSHLEFVNPVALGRMRAKQDRAGDNRRVRGMALLIHGEAAFAGEGITQETLNLSQLPGYETGGALHVVVNNQVGFTTPPAEGRSTHYATDVAKMLEIPIFHVNGDDPEAVAHVIRLAMDFRHHFKRDLVIDLYGYRRFGHNEGDEPSFTQPLLYHAIKKQKSVKDSYLAKLLHEGRIGREDVRKIEEEYRGRLDQEFALVNSADFVPSNQPFRGIWKAYCGGPESEVPTVETSVDKTRLADLLEAQTKLPAGFHPHPKLARSIETRHLMAAGTRPLDWSAAESLAFATLATEGVRVRLSGEDSERGTFSHRHAVLHDYETGQIYIPLQHLTPNQAPVEIFNSPLSEAGVLGFDYGYSLDYPDGLIMWEAQFGDFSNVAQVIIDQFITSAEQKWRRLSGLVLLLPHGFEGMGPEHSSARLERFLQVAADDNIQIVNPTTPAQYFHCLRRQALRKWRKPLVVLTPKSLLRHPLTVSALEEFSTGRFRPVLRDDSVTPDKVRRIDLCSGKIYYDLLAKKKELDRDDVALIRVEQLYPLPEKELRESLDAFSAETPVFWVQEEPENMGSWSYLNLRFRDRLFAKYPFGVFCRRRSASPATGSARVHKEEQDRLVTEALGLGRQQATGARQQDRSEALARQ